MKHPQGYNKKKFISYKVILLYNHYKNRLNFNMVSLRETQEQTFELFSPKVCISLRFLFNELCQKFPFFSLRTEQKIGHKTDIIDTQKSFSIIKSWYIRFVTQSKSHSHSHLHRLVHDKFDFQHLQWLLHPLPVNSCTQSIHDTLLTMQPEWSTLAPMLIYLFFPKPNQQECKNSSQDSEFASSHPTPPPQTHTHTHKGALAN